MEQRGLTRTQRSILVALSGMEPPWVLFGGGALLAAVAASRTTRDLDLRWTACDQLGPLVATVQRRLTEAGMAFTTLQTAPTFMRLQILGEEPVILDMVAQPSAELAEIQTVLVDGVPVPVPSPLDQCAEKLCALLGRAELRDLHDVSVLLAHGASLEQAAIRAAGVDGGFSPLTLAWVLRGFPIAKVAAAEGNDPALIARLTETRDRLVAELLALAAPDRDGANV